MENDLEVLGNMAKQPEANIIKLPNISASIPQLKGAIAELQAQGFAIPSYPDEPENDTDKDVKSRYDKIKGSAVNPVLREGNSDRRAPKAVKNYAKKNPHSMGAWSSESKSHVATMEAGDFAHNEKSVTISEATTVKIEHVDANGTVTTLKDNLALLQGEIIDATVMSKKALLSFLDAQVADAKANNVLFSLHMKATMMKVSDPIIFGHAVRTYFKDLFAKHNETFEAIGVDVNNGFGNLLSNLNELPEAKRNEIQADITDAVKGVISSTIMPNFLGGHDALDSFNTDYVSATIQRQTEDYMLNGRMDAEDAAEVARMDFERTHEKIKGDYIPNGGESFSSRLGLQDGRTPEAALDDFVDTNREVMFGAHEGDYSTLYNAANNSMTFVPVDANGIPTHGGRTIALGALKSLNVLAHAKEEANLLQANALKHQASMDSQILRVKMNYKRRYGKELSDEQALAEVNKQGESRLHMKNSVVQSIFQAMPQLKTLGAAPELIRSMAEPSTTPEQEATQFAVDEGVKHGIAIPTRTGMGWGMESVKAVGGTNEHVGYMLDVFAATESASGKFRANPVSSARGVFQYMTKGLSGGNNAMQTAVTRAMRAYPQGAPAWLNGLHNTAMTGTDEEREQAMMTLSDDHSAALMLLDFQGRPETAALLKKVQDGDKAAIEELYFKYHHTNPDAATTALFQRNMERWSAPSKQFPTPR